MAVSIVTFIQGLLPSRSSTAIDCNRHSFVEALQLKASNETISELTETKIDQIFNRTYLIPKAGVTRECIVARDLCLLAMPHDEAVGREVQMRQNRFRVTRWRGRRSVIAPDFHRGAHERVRNMRVEVRAGSHEDRTGRGCEAGPAAGGRARREMEFGVVLGFGVPWAPEALQCLIDAGVQFVDALEPGEGSTVPHRILLNHLSQLSPRSEQTGEQAWPPLRARVAQWEARVSDR